MGRYARKDGVFGAYNQGQCDALAVRAIYHPAEIWADGAYFSEQFVSQGNLVYKANGITGLYEFRICVYNKIVATITSKCTGWLSPTPPAGTPPVCFDTQAVGRAALSARLAQLAERAKSFGATARVIATQTLVSTTPGKLTSNLPLISIPSVTVRVGAGMKTMPAQIVNPPIVDPNGNVSDSTPMPRVDTAGNVVMSNQISLVEKEFQGIRYIAASDVDALGIFATLAVGAQNGNKVTATKDFSGAHWSVINANTTAESVDPGLLLSGLVANGDGIIMTSDAESVFITGTKFIQTAAGLCPVGQSDVFVLRDPATGWQVAAGDAPAATSDGTAPSNTMLYVGLGVGAAAVIGIVAYVAMRK